MIFDSRRLYSKYDVEKGRTEGLVGKKGYFAGSLTALQAMVESSDYFGKGEKLLKIEKNAPVYPFVRQRRPYETSLERQRHYRYFYLLEDK